MSKSRKKRAWEELLSSTPQIPMAGSRDKKYELRHDKYGERLTKLRIKRKTANNLRQ